MAKSIFQTIKPSLSNIYLNLVLRCSLGLIFIISSFTKMLDHTRFVEIVKEMDILPDSLAAAYGNALPWVELLVGVYLIFGILRRPIAITVILMAISFMVANINSIIDETEHCGKCFGDAFTLTVNQSITLDIIILTAAIVLVFPGKVKQLFTLEDIVNLVSRK